MAMSCPAASAHCHHMEHLARRGHAFDPESSPVNWDGETHYSEPIASRPKHVEFSCLQCGRFVGRVTVSNPRLAMLPASVRCLTCGGLPVPNGEVYPA